MEGSSEDTATPNSEESSVSIPASFLSPKIIHLFRKALSSINQQDYDINECFQKCNDENGADGGRGRGRGRRGEEEIVVTNKNISSDLVEGIVSSSVLPLLSFPAFKKTFISRGFVLSNSADSPNPVDDQFRLVDDLIDESLGRIDDRFEEVLETLAPVILETTRRWKKVDSQCRRWRTELSSLIRWTSEPEAIEHVLSLFLRLSQSHSDSTTSHSDPTTNHSASSYSVDLILAYLVLTAIFERSLKSVFSRISPNKPVPHLLRDVLLTPEIRNLVSPVGVVILRAFLGSSRSLNLRNIFWHGFCFPNTEDLPHFDGASSSCSSSTSPVLVLDFGFFLISCLCSIGQHLRFPGPRQPPRYNRHNLKALEDFCSNFPRHDFSFARLSSSPYLTPSLRSVAQDAISRLRGQQPAIDGDDNDGVEKEDGTFADEDVVNDSAASAVKDPEIACNSVVEGLTLMLPLIETVMRIRFAVANGCPKRLLTAECEEFYTTFEVMLAEMIRVLDNQTANSTASSTNVQSSADASKTDNDFSADITNTDKDSSANTTNSDRNYPADTTNPKTDSADTKSLNHTTLRRNSLPDRLGFPLMELLFDLLILPGGPRIRDRLSHGEIPFGLGKIGPGSDAGKEIRTRVKARDETNHGKTTERPESTTSGNMISFTYCRHSGNKIADCLLLIFDALITPDFISTPKRSLLNGDDGNGGDVNGGGGEINGESSESREFLSQYKSRFHPIAQLRQTIRGCVLFLVPETSSPSSSSSSSSSFPWSKFIEMTSLISDLEANDKEKERLDRREKEGRELTKLWRSLRTTLREKEDEMEEETEDEETMGEERKDEMVEEENDSLGVASVERCLLECKDRLLSICSKDRQPRTLFWDLKGGKTTSSEETAETTKKITNTATTTTTTTTTSAAGKNKSKANITFHDWKTTKRKKSSPVDVEDVHSADATSSLHHVFSLELIVVSRQCVEKIKEALEVLPEAWDSYREAWRQRKLRSRQRVTYLRYLLGLPHLLLFLSSSLTFSLKLYQIVIRQRSPALSSSSICSFSSSSDSGSAADLEMNLGPRFTTHQMRPHSPTAAARTALMDNLVLTGEALSVKWNRQLLTALENLVSEMEKNRWKEALQIAYGIRPGMTTIVDCFRDELYR